MNRSVNNVTLLGNLGKDAETTFTPSGFAKTTFSIATQRTWKDKNSGEWKEETDWHRVEIWRAEKLAEYLKKGTQVYVEGRLRTESWEKNGQKHYVTKVAADRVLLLGDRKRGEMDQSGPTDEEFSQAGVADDDVPF